MNHPGVPRHGLAVVQLALCGCLIAAYLAAFQLGVIGTVWEPFLGDGTVRVLDSAVSRMVPVPDAVIGAVAYAVEAVLVASGIHGLWRHHPWLGVATAAVVAGLAIAAVGLIALQALVIGAFCSLCLASAALSLAIFTLSRADLVAAWASLRGGSSQVSSSES